MSAKTRAWASALMRLVFKNEPVPGLGDAGGLRGSAQPGHLYIGLYLEKPTVGRDQGEHETKYIGYVREAVARGPGFTEHDGEVGPSADVDFQKCTGNPGAPIAWIGIGTAKTGAGMLLYVGAATPQIVMKVGVIPRWEKQSSVTED